MFVYLKQYFLSLTESLKIFSSIGLMIASKIYEWRTTNYQCIAHKASTEINPTLNLSPYSTTVTVAIHNLSSDG